MMTPFHSRHGELYSETDIEVYNKFRSNKGTLEENDVLYFLPSSTFSRFMLDYVKVEGVTRCVKPTKATKIVIPDTYTSETIWAAQNGETSKYQYSSYNKGYIKLSAKEQESIRKIIEFSLWNIPVITDSELYGLANNEYTVTESNYQELFNLLNSSDSVNKKLAIKLLKNSNREENIPLIYYLFINRYLDNSDLNTLGIGTSEITSYRYSREITSSAKETMYKSKLVLRLLEKDFNKELEEKYPGLVTEVIIRNENIL